jgi:hypothetical protein
MSFWWVVWVLCAIIFVFRIYWHEGIYVNFLKEKYGDKRNWPKGVKYSLRDPLWANRCAYIENRAVKSECEKMIRKKVSDWLTFLLFVLVVVLIS